MSQSKKPARKPKPAAPAVPPDRAGRHAMLLWLVFFAGSLFFIPQCLDRYLTPRFFFLSAILLGAVIWLWKEWRARADWELTVFDGVLLAWYGLNVLSVTWAFSWSEGVFYAQKVLLLFGVYWLVRQALHTNEADTRRTLAQITNALTLVVSVILLIQVGIAVGENGLNNERLYDYASGVFGNKGLASDFLFFLLIMNLLFKDEFKRKNLFWISAGVLITLLLVLQTRTVYLALAAAMLVYFPLRAVLEPGFRVFFLKRILPAAVVGVSVLAALLSWKGQGSTLTERLNPATYLESASARERRFVWYKTGELNKEHYWWGVGNGSWKIWFPSKKIEGGFRLQEKSIVFTRVHNDYLEIRAEMGIIGLFLFTGLFITVFLAAARALWYNVDSTRRRDILTLSVGLLGYCVIQYFDFPRERIELQAILALFFALLAFYCRPVWALLPVLPARRQAAFFLAALAAGLVFNLLVGWKRIDGEIHTVSVLKAQAGGNYPAMQREAAAASNAFYEYNDVTIPMQWFEGIALYQMNRVPEAVTAFEQAYRLNPWAFQVINNYASALVRSGRYQEAIPLFEQALRINPRYDEGKFNLAYSWYALGNRDKAIDWLGRVDTIPNPTTDDERRKNQTVLKQKADFQRVIDAEPR